MATSFSGGKRVAVPPMVCAVLWVCALHRRGWSLFGSLPTDITVALVTVAASLTFLVVAFDLSRLMAWTYFSFLILMIFYLFAARPITPPKQAMAMGLHTISGSDFFWTSPTLYLWVDLSHMLRCDFLCIKEQNPILNLYWQRVMALPITEYTAPGASVPGTTGRNENSYRVARAGRDKSGAVMNINIALDASAPGVTVRGGGQTKRAIISRGAHQLSLTYRIRGTQKSNAKTVFWIYDAAIAKKYEVLRAQLPAAQTEFSSIIEVPPDWGGNVFAWAVDYDGNGALELREVSFRKVDSP